MTNVKSLLALYLKMGGSLTDTYSDIAGGIPVGQYSLISDAVLACSKKYSSGGGSLPADFPTEGVANANKFIGFDENGDYTAKASGGGAEKFVVTLTEENDTWTADKTVSEIVAADTANQVVVCKASLDEETPPIELQLSTAVAMGDNSICLFVGIDGLEVTLPKGVTVVGQEENGSTHWEVSETPFPPPGSEQGDILVWDASDEEWKTRSNPNAPLIVTMTEDEQTQDDVGDKTNLEVYNAYSAGRNVVIHMSGGGADVRGSIINAIHQPGQTNEYAFEIQMGNGQSVFGGGANDFIKLVE